MTDIEQKALTFMQEAARDIALMHENIREGYMPEQSQAVIDAYQSRIKHQGISNG